jgi:hypothetical protein
LLKPVHCLLLLISLGGVALDREVALLGDTRSGSILGDSGTIPLGGGNGVDVEDIHDVDLLERTVFGLDDEEADDNSKAKTAATEDETKESVDVVDDNSTEK